MKKLISGDYKTEKEADNYFDNLSVKTKKVALKENHETVSNKKVGQKDYPNHLCTCCETEHHSFNRVVKRHDFK